MSETKRPSLAVRVYYRDPCAALKWLEEALGFETTMVVENEDGTTRHGEMRAGDGLIIVLRELDELRSPYSVSGVNTRSIHIQLDDGLDAHCERARAAGAVIGREPGNQFYGDRNYLAIDPEGHFWTFGQTIQVMSHAELSRASGLVVRDRL
jgi:uncharacterized glyoxalase superfamily protein PhnB